MAGQLKGVASYRILFPALLLLLNAGVWVLLAASGGVSATFCYGAAWLVAIAVLYLTTQSYSTAYPALCLIALGASVSTIFSLSPTYMHFTNRDRIVLPALVASVVLNLALCIPLSDRYGALGAAIAYAVPVSLLHAGLWLFELYDLVRYKLAMWHGNSCASAAHPLRAAPPRRTCRRAPTGWHPEAAPRRRPCRSPGLESTASPWLPPPRCWRSHD